MQNENRNRLIEVFAGTLWQAEIVKGLLDANNIPCTILDETIGAVTSAYSPIIGDVVVVVNKSDKDQAIEIIEKNSIK